MRLWKQQKRKFASITAYDASFARLFEQAGIQVMLVGDSLGMTMQGHDSTLPVRVEDIVYHTRCVRRGAPACLLLADLPFMSYATPAQSYEKRRRPDARRRQYGKTGRRRLAGGHRPRPDRTAVPVCGHLGLTPQSVNIFGGYKIQGRDADSAEQLFKDAVALEQAGAQLLVLECVPVSLAQRVTEALAIPVIGIGAGNVTDGQILVMQDALGITGQGMPKFAKVFSPRGEISAAPFACMPKKWNKDFIPPRSIVFSN